jgi:hypothetical protein
MPTSPVLRPVEGPAPDDAFGSARFGFGGLISAIHEVHCIASANNGLADIGDGAG